MNRSSLHHSRGFSLIEVMIAVVVLSFGLLALAALQTNLFRAGAETKARANATAMAQQIIEESKGFAYVAAPTGFTGATYTGLTTASLGSQSIGGVTYTVCRQVRRYRLDATTNRFVALNGVDAAGCADTGTVAAPFSPGVAEFKEVRVNVSWQDESGAEKTVELTDSIAAIAPADAARVVSTPTDGSRGPEVWIVPPNKDNPQVVPIAIGDNQSAASSNPKPEQFVDDVVAATTFSVQTFTGSSSGEEVRLNRKLDVAAVSCECAANRATSTASNPAFQIAQWSGKQLAYLEPQALPAGTPIATAVVSNTNREIQEMCTTCCRDHHIATLRKPTPDPYRVRLADESEHHGYKRQGSGYAATLLPLGDQTGNQYIDSCQLIRVNGRRRMVMDAQINHLLVTPLDATRTSYRNPSFIDRFSSFVTTSVGDGMSALPNVTGYPGPSATFPRPTTTRLAEYADVDAPEAIALAEGDTHKLVAFGLYVDYINADTRQAYNCAGKPTGTSGCDGLTSRSPLEVLPLYAVNVANLGDWVSEKPTVAGVSGTVYDNKGLLVSDAGVVTTGSGGATDPFSVKLSIGLSNSGLAASRPVDPDDRDQLMVDGQPFTKAAGTSTSNPKTITVTVANSSQLQLNKLSWSAPCSFSSNNATAKCTYTPPATSVTTVVSGYTTQGNGANATITDRKLCVPSTIGIVVANNGLTTETSTLRFSSLSGQDVAVEISLVDSGTLCPSGTHSGG